uniref:Uncharacterized protein n=1 Tax=Takifugu rubripes RNA virus TaxID=2652723 RepID=A0A6J4AGV1_9VIRU|nr:hypothetical protein [Takifugu rubripes RNA virus]
MPDGHSPDLIGTAGRANVEVKVSTLSEPPLQEGAESGNIVVFNPVTKSVRTRGPQGVLLNAMMEAASSVYEEVLAIGMEAVRGYIDLDDPEETRERALPYDWKFGLTKDIPEWIKNRDNAPEAVYVPYERKEMISKVPRIMTPEVIDTIEYKRCWGFIQGLTPSRGGAVLQKEDITAFGFLRNEKRWFYPVEMKGERPTKPKKIPLGLPSYDPELLDEVYAWYQKGTRKNQLGWPFKAMPGLYVMCTTLQGAQKYTRSKTLMFLFTNALCPEPHHGKPELVGPGGDSRQTSDVVWSLHRMDVGHGKHKTLRQTLPAAVMAAHDKDGKSFLNWEGPVSNFPTAFSNAVMASYMFHNCGALSEARVLMHCVASILDGGRVYMESIEVLPEMIKTSRCPAARAAMVAFARHVDARDEQ